MHPDDPRLSAETITQKSGSNLALSFFSLSKERKVDMTVFYAFCRIIDDIVDEQGMPAKERLDLLNAWRRSIESGSPSGPGLGPQIQQLIQKYTIPKDPFFAIIDGCEMDLTIKRYPDFQSLLTYCYRVASAVGLVSIEIFGYQSPSTRDYAIQLGYALQLTNITRDVATDYRNDGRIYLPTEDFERFNYSEADLRKELYNEAFVELMRFQADRAETFYHAADRVLTEGDRPKMIAAAVMRAVYWKILDRLRKDRFQVFKKSYRLGKLEKLWIAFETWWHSPK